MTQKLWIRTTIEWISQAVKRYRKDQSRRKEVDAFLLQFEGGE